MEKGKERIFGIGFLLLLLIGKKLNTYNSDNWQKARYRAIYELLRCIKYKESPLILPLEVCTSIHSATSAIPRIRGNIVDILRQLAAASIRYAILFKMVLKQLEFTEMTHVRLIMGGLYGANPEVLFFPERKAERKNMAKMASYIVNSEPWKIPFLKLYCDSDDTSELLSYQLKKHITAALAIQHLSSKSSQNIKSSYVDDNIDLYNRVQNYMSVKQSKSALFAAAHLRDKEGGTANEEFFSSISKVHKIQDNVNFNPKFGARARDDLMADLENRE